MGDPVLAPNVKLTGKNIPIFLFALISHVFGILNLPKRLFNEVFREKFVLLTFILSEHACEVSIARFVLLAKS